MRLGLCIDARARTPPRQVEALGATAVSFPLVPHLDVSQQARALERYRTLGWDVAVVLGPQAIQDGPDWRASIMEALRQAHELLAIEAVTHVILGHEPDDGWRGDQVADDPLVVPRGGVGSWVLSCADLAELIHRARTILGTHTPLLLGGLVSGRPEFVGRLDLSGVDGLLVHPYADLDLDALLDGYQAEIAAQGLDGRVSLGIGELGRSDYTLRRGVIADWYGQVLRHLAARGDVSACFVCCDSDLTLDGYGVFDAEDRPKPSVAAIFAATRGLDPSASLVAPRSDRPDQDAAPEVNGSLPWPPGLPLGALELASALAWDDEDDSDAETVRALAALWPELGPHLAYYGVDGDPAPSVAILATIWTASDGDCRPTVERGDYDRCERLYGRGSQTGVVLGNVRHGDGHRFRGRGLVPLRGRAAYARYSALLGLDLVADPDLLAEPAVASALLAAQFEEHGLWGAARRGDYAAIRRVFDAGLNRYEPFLEAVQRLWSALDRREQDQAPPPDPARLKSVLAAARALDGASDGGELVARAYRRAGAATLSSDPDALADETAAIGPEAAVPGDLVLYSYADPSRGGAHYAHVALVGEADGLVLDGRAGLGAALRPHVRGAVRRYRRVPLDVAVVLDSPTGEEDDEVLWRERYEALAEGSRRTAQALDEVAARLVPPPVPARPPEKAAKSEHVDYGQAAWRWQEQAREIAAEGVQKLRAVAVQLRDAAEEG